ncbi:MAG: alpha/beta hydrolase [Cyclobacteriaceae bacterium]|nr:alpha/beta hydrolase [Cyclobacteriaceae bacterium]
MRKYISLLILIFISITMMGKDLVEQTISLSTGVQLNYVEQGDSTGTTIIFLHGYTDSWHSFEDILPRLPKGYHLIAMSQRGHGNSSKPENGYTLKIFADDLAEFINMKKLGTCIVVGHSMGGLVAQQFAADYPNLARSIVIVSSDTWYGDNPGIPEFLDGIIKSTGPIDRNFAEEFQTSTLSNPIDDAMLKLFIDETMKVPANVWKKVAQTHLSTNLIDSLYKIQCPAMVICGGKDVICPQKDQERLANGISNATFILYHDAGHAIHWEKPERFAKDLIDFVQKI